MINENIYLRYYEILFHKYIMNLYTSHNMSTAQLFFQTSLDMMNNINATLLLGAARRILSLDSTLKIFRDEYIVCMGTVTDKSKAQIRKDIKCSPNVVLNAYEDFKQGKLYIQPRFDILTSRDIMQYMEDIENLFNIN